MAGEAAERAAVDDAALQLQRGAGAAAVAQAGDQDAAAEAGVIVERVVAQRQRPITHVQQVVAREHELLQEVGALAVDRALVVDGYAGDADAAGEIEQGCSVPYLNCAVRITIAGKAYVAELEDGTVDRLQRAPIAVAVGIDPGAAAEPQCGASLGQYEPCIAPDSGAGEDGEGAAHDVKLGRCDKAYRVHRLGNGARDRVKSTTTAKIDEANIVTWPGNSIGAPVPRLREVTAISRGIGWGVTLRAYPEDRLSVVQRLGADDRHRHVFRPPTAVIVSDRDGEDIVMGGEGTELLYLRLRHLVLPADDPVAAIGRDVCDQGPKRWIVDRISC